MKILVDCHSMRGESQGITTYISGLYEALLEQYPEDYEVYLWGAPEECLVKYFRSIEKFRVIEYEPVREFERLTYALKSVVKKYSIDYCHFQYTAPILKYCKYIVTVHDLLFLDFPKQFGLAFRVSRTIAFYLSLFRADIRLTVSEYSKRRIEALFFLKKVHVTPNGVAKNENVADNDLRNTLEKYDLKKYILYVSRFELRKNHSSLVEAFFNSGLYKQGFKLVLVGNKTYGSFSIDELISTYELEFSKNVLVVEGVSNKDLSVLYKGCDLFVYPSLGEGFGIPPLEAVSYGINTICSNTTAMSEFTFLGDNLYDPHSAGELTRLLRSNVLNPPSAEVLLRNREYVLWNYNWHRSSKILDELVKLSSVKKK